jgi:hypothetical protein
MSKQFQIAKQFNAERFTWSTAGGKYRGLAEASELGLRPGEVPYSPVYVDACDAGCTLVNPKKGTCKDFLLESEDSGRWTFQSLDGKVRLTILND